MSVELGNREVQMITDAIKSVVNDAIKFGNSENFKMLDGSYMKNAEDWRTSIISNLIQGTQGDNYATHTSVLFNHTNKIDSNIKSVRLETLVDYALDVFNAFDETETLGDLTEPEFLWTGFEETSEAIYDIAMELTNDFDLEIPSVSEYDGDIRTLLVETNEALMGSDIKAGDVTNSLELQIRVLDDIRVNELYQMYGTFPSTEGVRPFMIQLIELHDQVDNLDDDLVSEAIDALENLYISNDPGFSLKEINPGGKGRPSIQQVVKNQIKYFFEEMTNLQDRYINFNYSPSTIFQSTHNSDIERMFGNMGSIVDPMRNAFGDMIFSTKEPAQFTTSFKVFDGIDTDLPFQINKTYMNRFQEIAGRKAYDVTLDPNFAKDINASKNLTAGEFISDYVSMNIYENRIDDDMREKLNRISINDANADLPYDPRYITPDQFVTDLDNAISNKKLTKTEFKNILKTIEKNVTDTFDLQTHSVFITYLENELKARGYDLSDKTLQKQLDNWAMNNTDFLTARGSQGLLYEDLKNIDNAEGVGFIGLAEGLDEDMNVIDLDNAISKADGVENLNKSKAIMNKNPGVFKKIFSVLEKLDVGDQVITKAVLPTLGKLGVAGATGPLALAYTAYEMGLLLYDVANSSYKAQTTDEDFWDNFGEISDKYSIAYKISKPVYDIILDNLSKELEQEDEEFIPQYSYDR